MLMVTNLQQELQSMIFEAKSEYESNLALTYALLTIIEYFSTSQVSKIITVIQFRCSTMTSKHQPIPKKPSYSMICVLI